MVLSELNEFLLRLNLKFQTTGGKPEVIKKNIKSDQFDGAIWQKSFFISNFEFIMFCLLMQKLPVGDEASCSHCNSLNYTQHNDIKHNSTQYNDTQNNENQHNNLKGWHWVF